MKKESLDKANGLAREFASNDCASASSRAASTPSSPPESNGHSEGDTSSGTAPSSSVSSAAQRAAGSKRASWDETEGDEEGAGPLPAVAPSDQQRRTGLQRPVMLPLAIVPSSAAAGACTPGGSNTTPGGGMTTRGGRLLHRRKSTLGALSADSAALDSFPELMPWPETRTKLPEDWRPPLDACPDSLERSELGAEATVEVRRWLMGETSGMQCSQVVLDRALTVLSNFKLASGCQLQVLGGPLGALVGGYSSADWLYDEIFKKPQADALRDAFTFLSFRTRNDGDWSMISVEEISLVYRRMCLRGHPSRGGSPQDYLKLQVSMELIKAFCGEGASVTESLPLRQSPTGQQGSKLQPFVSSSPVSGATPAFVLSDLALSRELQLSAAEAEAEASKLPAEQLEEMNRALDEYILRQMCFKSEIIDEIARLHEDSAYAILGVTSGATDNEIKKAYRIIAMQCHPDKGGDKDDFQELSNAYEKIMEQRRTANGGSSSKNNNDPDSDLEEPTPEKPKRRNSKNTSKEAKKGDGEAEEAGATESDGEDADQDADGAKAEGAQGGSEERGPGAKDGTTAALLEKVKKAAEEASRYAKTAAEFAHQAAEAAEAARKDQERGSRDSLTKSVAHSAIVYTLTVVKAVRAVGYATLDVAAQCRAAAKRNLTATACGEQAVTAMSLGLEALNAALSCAEVTEITAAELQAPSDSSDELGAARAAERFVGAAVRASLAAAGASNAAMAAAIAAVEGSRQCAKALEKSARIRRSKSGDAADEEDEASADGEQEDDAARAEEKLAHEESEKAKPRPAPPTAEQMAAAANQRLVAQRNNNHKVLQRLNAEILGHQKNVREFLRANRQLIPGVSSESKQKIFGLLRDYASEAWAEVSGMLQKEDKCEDCKSVVDRVYDRLSQLSLLVPFLQPKSLAIPVSVKARVLKMAALYDLPLAERVLDEELFSRVRASLGQIRPGDQDFVQRLEELLSRVSSELVNNVAEEGAVLAMGGQTPGSTGCCASGGQTPQGFGGAGQTPSATEERGSERFGGC